MNDVSVKAIVDSLWTHTIITHRDVRDNLLQDGLSFNKFLVLG